MQRSPRDISGAWKLAPACSTGLQAAWSSILVKSQAPESRVRRMMQSGRLQAQQCTAGSYHACRPPHWQPCSVPHHPLLPHSPLAPRLGQTTAAAWHAACAAPLRWAHPTGKWLGPRPPAAVRGQRVAAVRQAPGQRGTGLSIFTGSRALSRVCHPNHLQTHRFRCCQGRQQAVQRSGVLNHQRPALCRERHVPRSPGEGADKTAALPCRVAKCGGPCHSQHAGAHHAWPWLGSTA